MKHNFRGGIFVLVLGECENHVPYIQSPNKVEINFETLPFLKFACRDINLLNKQTQCEADDRPWKMACIQVMKKT